ncbi:MAG: MMPL family transporter [Planctomycetota bacterium]
MARNESLMDEGTNHSLSTRLFFWWADHGAVQLALFVLLTSFAVIGYMRPEWVQELFTSPVVESNSQDAEAERNFDPAQSEQPPENVTPFQVAGGDCILVASLENDSPGDFFDRESLSTLREVVTAVEAMPQVRGVLWLDSIPEFNLFGLSGTLVPNSNASQRRFDEARRKVLANPLAVGQMVSKDARTMLIHLELDWFFVGSDHDATDAIREQAEAVAKQFRSKLRDRSERPEPSEGTETTELTFRLTGRVPLHIMTANNHLTDSFKYQLIGYSIMLISAIVLFRGLSAVLIVAMSPAVGVFWTIGFLHFLDLQDNPFNDIIVPVLISLVGLADSVHLMVEIRQQRASGLETREAARRGIARVGLACLLTSTTTAIGFLSLGWAHHEIVREFGSCCVVGVIMTFVSVLTVVPLGCRSPLGRRLHIGIGTSLIDAQLKRVGPVVEWVLQHHRGVSGVAIALTVALAALAFQLNPDEKRYSGLSDSGEAAIALRHLDRAMGGIEFGYVHVYWPQNTSSNEIVSVLNSIDTLMADEELLGQPLGLIHLLRALPGDDDLAMRMPLLELLPPSLKRSFYTPEYQWAKVQFRVQDLGIAAYSSTFERMQSRLQNLQQQHSGFQIVLSGNAVWRWQNVYQIVTDLAKSLGAASVVIWIILTCVYRSFRIGLISIIPNVFPLAATAAILVVMGQHLEMVTVCVFTICLGIAVDDTIHFLTRYQEEARTGGAHDAVIRRAFTGVGSALLMTTIVLVTGLGSAIFGDARDARIFGIMGCLTLTTALLADVLFLPALLIRFGKASK